MERQRAPPLEDLVCISCRLKVKISLQLWGGSRGVKQGGGRQRGRGGRREGRRGEEREKEGKRRVGREWER